MAPVTFPPLNEQMDLVRRGVSEIIPEEDLARKIERSITAKKPLIVKLGCDPSRPDLHLGHSVVLRKLRQFQDLGHTAVLIVGDFTGMIGDPSGKSKTRPSLSLEETRKNGESYFEQARKVLSDTNVRMVYNSEWLGPMSFAEVIKLAAKYTVSQMLEREDFHTRFNKEEPISLHEFLYPLAQAMDSVAIESDVELGGTDQKFNLLVGRAIQREFGKEPQVILTMPILPGTDGVEKMSKSLDNYIGISEAPKEIFGKTLSIPDRLMYDFFVLATNTPNEHLAGVKTMIADRPRDAKRLLARTLVTLYHNAEAAAAAEEEFDRIFVKKDVPDEMEELRYGTLGAAVPVLQLLTETGLAPSRSEARRLVEQGGVSVNGAKVADPKAELTLSGELVVKVGKRKFLKVLPS
ncbi:MAG: tyrosine--tRNA ligase [Bacteroidetes bacterium]|nr:MAG: tyrosine--tRNA ligase [Bacteroidota bacterium]